MLYPCNNPWELTEDQSTTMRISFLNKLFKAHKWQADGAKEEQNHWSSPSFSSSSSSSSPSFLPSFFITDSFFLAKNIGDGIQTCVSKFKPSLVQGLVLLGIVGRSDGQDIHLSHQLSHQRFLSVSLLLVSVLSILCITPALRAISLFYELWRLFRFVSFFFFFFGYNTKILYNLNPPTTTTTAKLATKFFNRCLAVRLKHSNSKQAQQLASFKGAMKAK